MSCAFMSPVASLDAHWFEAAITNRDSPCLSHLKVSQGSLDAERHSGDTEELLHPTADHPRRWL